MKKTILFFSIMLMGLSVFCQPPVKPERIEAAPASRYILLSGGDNKYDHSQVLANTNDALLGGNISESGGNLLIGLDVNNLEQLPDEIELNDELIVFDASLQKNRKMKISNLPLFDIQRELLPGGFITTQGDNVEFPKDSTALAYAVLQELKPGTMIYSNGATGGVMTDDSPQFVWVYDGMNVTKLKRHISQINVESISTDGGITLTPIVVAGSVPTDIEFMTWFTANTTANRGLKQTGNLYYWIGSGTINNPDVIWMSSGSATGGEEYLRIKDKIETSSAVSYYDSGFGFYVSGASGVVTTNPSTGNYTMNIPANADFNYFQRFFDDANFGTELNGSGGYTLTINWNSDNTGWADFKPLAFNAYANGQQYDYGATGQTSPIGSLSFATPSGGSYTVTFTNVNVAAFNVKGTH